jgi:hypothetical protein
MFGFLFYYSFWFAMKTTRTANENGTLLFNYGITNPRGPIIECDAELANTNSMSFGNKNPYFLKPKNWYNYLHSPPYLRNIQARDFETFDFSLPDKLLATLKPEKYLIQKGDSYWY